MTLPNMSATNIYTTAQELSSHLSRCATELVDVHDLQRRRQLICGAAQLITRAEVPRYIKQTWLLSTPRDARHLQNIHIAYRQ